MAPVFLLVTATVTDISWMNVGSVMATVFLTVTVTAMEMY